MAWRAGRSIRRLFGTSDNASEVSDLLVAAGFDERYYLSQLDGEELRGIRPVEHYHRVGWKRGLDPSPWFCVRSYLADNPDVSGSDMDPLLHYARHGRVEGRPVRPVGVGSAPARELLADDGSTVETRTVGVPSRAKRGDEPSGPMRDVDIIRAHMDEAFYLSQLPGEEGKTGDAAEHYLHVGHNLGLDPAPDFSTRAYLTDHPDVALASLNAFLHYLKRGGEERRVTRSSDFQNGNKRTSNGRREWADYDAVLQRGRRVLDNAKPRPKLLD